MKSFAIFTVALCLMAAASSSRAGDTNTIPVTIGTAQASDYIGKQVTVTGVVAQVSVKPNLTHLDFDKRYPSNLFTAIIWSSHTNEFDNLRALKGKTVSVKGQVIDYKGKPEMELTNKSQLKILSDTK